MQAWVQKEAMSMLRLQEALEQSISTQTGSDTDEGDDAPPSTVAGRTHKFKLPRRLRGWLFLKRSKIQRTDWTSVLQFTHGSYDFKKVRRTLIAIYPEQVLKEYEHTNPSAVSGRPMRASWSYDPVGPDVEDDQMDGTAAAEES